VVSDEDGRPLDDVSLDQLLLAGPGTALGDLVGPPWPVTIPRTAAVAQIAAPVRGVPTPVGAGRGPGGNPLGRILADHVVDMLMPGRGRFRFPRVLS
jgi:hypothetical protein